MIKLVAQSGNEYMFVDNAGVLVTITEQEVRILVSFFEKDVRGVSINKSGKVLVNYSVPDIQLYNLQQSSSSQPQQALSVKPAEESVTETTVNPAVVEITAPITAEDNVVDESDVETSAEEDDADLSELKYDCHTCKDFKECIATGRYEECLPTQQFYKSVYDDSETSSSEYEYSLSGDGSDDYDEEEAEYEEEETIEAEAETEEYEEDDDEYEDEEEEAEEEVSDSSADDDSSEDSEDEDSGYYDLDNSEDDSLNYEEGFDIDEEEEEDDEDEDDEDSNPMKSTDPDYKNYIDPNDDEALLAYTPHHMNGNVNRAKTKFADWAYAEGEDDDFDMNELYNKYFNEEQIALYQQYSMYLSARIFALNAVAVNVNANQASAQHYTQKVLSLKAQSADWQYVGVVDMGYLGASFCGYCGEPVAETALSGCCRAEVLRQKRVREKDANGKWKLDANGGYVYTTKLSRSYWGKCSECDKPIHPYGTKSKTTMYSFCSCMVDKNHICGTIVDKNTHYDAFNQPIRFAHIVCDISKAPSTPLNDMLNKKVSDIIEQPHYKKLGIGKAATFFGIDKGSLAYRAMEKAQKRVVDDNVFLLEQYKSGKRSDYTFIRDFITSYIGNYTMSELFGLDDMSLRNIDFGILNTAIEMMDADMILPESLLLFIRDYFTGWDLDKFTENGKKYPVPGGCTNLFGGVTEWRTLANRNMSGQAVTQESFRSAIQTLSNTFHTILINDTDAISDMDAFLEEHASVIPQDRAPHPLVGALVYKMTNGLLADCYQFSEHYTGAGGDSDTSRGYYSGWFNGAEAYIAQLESTPDHEVEPVYMTRDGSTKAIAFRALRGMPYESFMKLVSLVALFGRVQGLKYPKLRSGVSRGKLAKHLLNYSISTSHNKFEIAYPYTKDSGISWEKLEEIKSKCTISKACLNAFGALANMQKPDEGYEDLMELVAEVVDPKIECATNGRGMYRLLNPNDNFFRTYYKEHATENDINKSYKSIAKDLFEEEVGTSQPAIDFVRDFLERKLKANPTLQQEYDKYNEEVEQARAAYEKEQEELRKKEVEEARKKAEEEAARKAEEEAKKAEQAKKDAEAKAAAEQAKKQAKQSANSSAKVLNPVTQIDGIACDTKTASGDGALTLGTAETALGIDDEFWKWVFDPNEKIEDYKRNIMKSVANLKRVSEKQFKYLKELVNKYKGVTTTP